MTLDLRIREENDHILVDCGGRLVAGVTDVLYSEVKPLLQRERRIVIDLTNCVQMDSMGLGTIMRLYVSARSAGSQLELINLNKRIRELFGISGLLSVLETVGQQGIRMP